MQIVVAGGTGFLGRHVVSELAERGHRVVVLSRGAGGGFAHANVDGVACDVSDGDLPLERIRGSDAIVNLIGIKRETSTQSFARVHVDATRHLVEAARETDVRRMIHISVVAARPDQVHAYHDSKWQAEELVRESGLDVTVLRPGVIYGPGDDMITHLVKMIRFCPLFPVVGRGRSQLQPVSGVDVARVVAAAIENQAAIGKTYDVVGPEPMPLGNVVRTVAEGAGLNVWVVPTPIWFQRFGVWLMNRLFSNPLSTPAQLQMLIDGLAGDPVPVARELGIEPAPFTPEVIAAVEAAIPSLFGFSLRFLRGSGYRKPVTDECSEGLGS